jgi:hypothetical protein
MTLSGRAASRKRNRWYDVCHPLDDKPIESTRREAQDVCHPLDDNGAQSTSEGVRIDCHLMDDKLVESTRREAREDCHLMDDNGRERSTRSDRRGAIDGHLASRRMERRRRNPARKRAADGRRGLVEIRARGLRRRRSTSCGRGRRCEGPSACHSRRGKRMACPSGRRVRRRD